MTNAASVPCFNCLQCVAVCPANLLPNYLYHVCLATASAEMVALRLADCTLCGRCQAVCPAEFPLVEVLHDGQKSLASEQAQDQDDTAATVPAQVLRSA